MRRKVFLITALLLVSLALPQSSPTLAWAAAQLVVINTADNGAGSLRQAIVDANSTPGSDIIVFNIPMSDLGFDGSVFTIAPSTPLPGIFDDETTIDGSTQTLFTGETNAAGPEVVLSGSRVALTTGLRVFSDSNRIRGLVVNAFEFSGIDLHGANNIVEDNFIGTDPAGTVAVPNNAGISCNNSDNVIRGNLLSGNREFGIYVLGGHRNRIEGNLIGTDASGTAPLGNGAGVGLEAANSNVIGGLGPGRGNVIAFNCNESVCSDGVVIIMVTDDPQHPSFELPSLGNTISGNSIFSNGGLGIDLGFGFHGDGVTPNDPGDLDTGPNNLMNFPVLESALAARGRLVVRGEIDTPNPELVIIEFFASEPEGDSSGHGEGQTFLGIARPNRKGKFTAPLPPVTAGTLVTATATDVFGNTSEFSANVEAAIARGR